MKWPINVCLRTAVADIGRMSSCLKTQTNAYEWNGPHSLAKTEEHRMQKPVRFLRASFVTAGDLASRVPSTVINLLRKGNKLECLLNEVNIL